MAIKFYLYHIDNEHEIHCNTNSSITEIAGAFNGASFELEWNTTEAAIFPNTPFFIVDTSSNEIWSYIVSQDNVEVVKKITPVKYIHHLTLSQATHKLNFHQLRNSVFSQPFERDKTFSSNHGFGVLNRFDSDGNPINLNRQATFFYPYNDNSYLSQNYSTSFESGKNKFLYAKLKVVARYARYAEGSVLYDSGQTMKGFQYTGDPMQFTDTEPICSIQFVNANDFSDTITINIIDDGEIDLTQQEIEWCKGKRFFFKPITLRITNIPDYLYYGPHMEGFENSNVIGFIEITLQSDSFYYSLWDVLNTIQIQCQKNYEGDVSIPTIYTMPDKTSEKGQYLDSIVAPEFSFTGLDLFSAVAEVFKFIDAFPVLKPIFSANGTHTGDLLDFVFLNDLSNDEITDLIVSDKKTKINETNFTNRLTTVYQNGRQQNAIYFPSSYGYKNCGTTKLGVVDRDDFWMIVDKPIDYIDGVYIYIGTSIKVNFSDFQMFDSPYSLKYYFSNYPLGVSYIDISKAIFEKDVYSLLPVSDPRYSFPNQNNTLYYTRYDNKIYLGTTTDKQTGWGSRDILAYAIEACLAYKFGLRGMPSSISYNITLPNKEDVKFRVKYHALYDGKVAQESVVNKYNGETPATQINGNIEINRMGNFLQGLIARVGNEEKSITLPITTELSNRVKVGTLWRDSNNDIWLVNEVKTTFTTKEDKVIVEATLTKNYNMISQYLKVNQEKRFYQIDRRITTKGYENINEYLYFTNRDINNSALKSLNNYVCIYEKALAYCIAYIFIGDDFDQEVEFLEEYGYGLNLFYIQAKSINKWFYLPTHTYGNGNQICVEMSFDDPINAGYRTFINSNSKMVTEATLYCEKTGFEDIYTIEGFQDSPTTFSSAFPEVTGAEVSSSGNLRFQMQNYYYYKKPNEIFHLNYSLNFLPYWTKTTDELGTPIYTYDEIFFGDMYIDNNPLIQGSLFDSGNKKLYVSNKKLSIIDNKIDSTQTYLSDVKLLLTVDQTNTLPLTMEFTDLNGNHLNISSYASWCIADKFGNIIIGANNSENSMQQPKLKVFSSRRRKV